MNDTPDRPRIRPASSDVFPERPAREQPTRPRPAVDESTYYEYLEAHTGEHSVSSGQTPVPVNPAFTHPGTGHTAAGHPVGAPAPVPPRRRTGPNVLGVIGGVLVLSLLAFLLVTAVLPDDGVEPAVLDTPPASGEGPRSGPNVSQASSSASDAEIDAELERLVTTGKAAAEEDLDGAWVVQLSAKQDGLRTDGRTWTKRDILSEFESTKARHPEAILLWSGDWKSYKLPDYWVTVLDTAYPGPEEALRKCRDLGLDRDHCFAKKLSTTEGPEKATRLNK